MARPRGVSWNYLAEFLGKLGDMKGGLLAAWALTLAFAAIRHFSQPLKSAQSGSIDGL